MKLGDLFVLLKANTSDFAKGISSSMEQIEHLAKKVKRATHEIEQTGLGLAAVAGGAVALASTVDKGIGKELENLKHSFEDLAVPVARLVIPAMREVASWVRQLADWFAGLSPHTKTAIAHFLEIAVAVGAVAMIISKVALAIQGLTAVLALVTAAPFLVVVTVLAAIAATVVFLHKVWRENWGGIQEATKNVIEEISKYWTRFESFLGDIWDSLIDSYGKVLKGVLSITAAILVATGKATQEQADQQVAFSKSGVDVAMNALKHGGISKAALDLGKTMKDGFLDAAGALKKELGIILKDFNLSNGGHAERHGGIPRTVTSGMDGAAELSMQASEQKLAVEADHLAANVKIYTEMYNHALYEAAVRRAQIESSFMGRLQSALAALGEGIRSQTSSLLSKLGTFGEVMNAAAQGMATGGPWGALIAVIIELVSKMGSFTRMLDYFEGNIGKHLEKLSQMLEPIFSAFQQLSEVVDGLTDAAGGWLDGMNLIKGIFWVIGKVIGGISLVIVGLAKQISDAFGNHDKGLADMQAQIEKELGTGFNTIKTPAQQLGSTLTKVNDKFNEMLVNMPTGYKLADARFHADAATGGSTSGSWGGSSLPGSSDPNTTYGRGSDGTPNVSQGQTSTSTRPDGGASGGMSIADQLLWNQVYATALATGMTPAQASAFASAQVAATHNNTGSSSSAATAAGGGGGGGNVGIHQLAGTPAAADGPLAIYVAGNLLVQAATPLALYRELVKVAKVETARRKRNSE